MIQPGADWGEIPARENTKYTGLPIYQIFNFSQHNIIMYYYFNITTRLARYEIYKTLFVVYIHRYQIYFYF